jgi:hypothetical protein
LLNIKPIPLNQDKCFIQLLCTVEFEPFGRASEDWDIIWKLFLPETPYYWKSTTGWRKGDKSGMAFYGRTENEVIGKAINFIKEARLQGLNV